MDRTGLEVMEVPIKGMDCTECTLHVQKAIAALEGVENVQVFLAAEKAVIRLDAHRVDLPAIRKAVEGAGYQVGQSAQAELPPAEAEAKSGRVAALEDFTRPVLTLLGVVFGVVLFVVVVGEWLGLFEAVTSRVPWAVGLVVVLVAGYPVFRNVLRATFKGQVISHTLMTLGVIAALAVGEWATAAVVVFLMRVGDYAERFTTERARRAVKDLTALAPQMARLERGEEEIEVPVSQVQAGEMVVVRPGEMIPVDGVVAAGQATVDQATLTGEAMPVEAGPGTRVFAATLVKLGSLRVKTVHVGSDTTFGRVIRLVEEAEAHRADVQRIADKFSAWYLPVVGGIAGLTFLLRRDPLATAAVLVVACSCSFALATPIAMLASIGAAAKHGLMIKGGKYLELLAQADTLLIDKTGTLTLGKPRICDFRLMEGDWKEKIGMGVEGQSKNENLTSRVLQLAASAERYSEHPLGEAVRTAAREQGLALEAVQEFEALPGFGVQARVGETCVAVGSRRIFRNGAPAEVEAAAAEFEAQGKSVLFVVLDDQPAALLAATDTLRPEVPQAIRKMQELGVRQVELLTGDNERAAAALVQQLALGTGQNLVKYRAGLLPGDKIEIVRQYQAQGHKVIMVGDGVNDAPALAQADVGIAMGAAGSDVAIEAAHIALMREDWNLVPEVVEIARRTMRVVKGNIAFTLLYNTVGLSLAAFGLLPPIFAAAAQSLPDLGILANSARLLRSR
jgi:Cu+-exporting ATPase